MGNMSHDRVRFFLEKRYFQDYNSPNGMRRDICVDILCETLGMIPVKTKQIMRDNPEGFWITCRPSQFARFIVIRNSHGDCINGVKDLKPELFIPVDDAQLISNRMDAPDGDTYVSRKDVRAVLKQLHSYVLQKDRTGQHFTLDVSMNHAKRDPF